MEQLTSTQLESNLSYYFSSKNADYYNAVGLVTEYGILNRLTAAMFIFFQTEAWVLKVRETFPETILMMFLYLVSKYQWAKATQKLHQLTNGDDQAFKDSPTPYEVPEHLTWAGYLAFYRERLP